jgi:hypothetical protein
VAQWWTGEQQTLAQFGCSGCTARLGSPTPPVKKRMISIGCSAQQQPPPQGVAVLAWSVDDFESGDDSDDGTDQAADAGDQDDEDDALSITEEPADAAPASAANAPAKPADASDSMAASVTPIPMSPRGSSRSVMTLPRHIPPAPRFYPYPPMIEDAATSGPAAATEAAPSTLRPVPDEELFEKYFQYVTRWTTYLVQGGTLEAAKNVDSPDPFPAKMSGEGRNAVTAAAYDYLHTWQDWSRKTQPPATGAPTATMSSIPQQPRDSPGIPGADADRNRQRWDERMEERDALVKAKLEKIKGQIGSTGYRSLDAYVLGIYHARPGRWVQEPMPEKTVVLRYLRYVGALDRSAEDGAQADWAKSRRHAWMSRKPRG